MPEIGEVGRIVHYLKKHAVSRTIRNVLTTSDDIVYGKVGTSAEKFSTALKGKKILSAHQQGKYFWLEMDSSPHPLMHFGMTGWMKFSDDDSSYYKPAKKEEEETWPPKFWKFCLQFEGEKNGENEVAFVDARRLARIRLVDAKGADMRKTTPLKENGPDPVQDKKIVTREWLGGLVGSKKVPIKALLLNQANISGVGNWVGDEVLYEARIHPEQYSNTLNEDQIRKLHDALVKVCTIAVETLADSSKFPEEWLMRHRWGKGKNKQNVLPNGDKIEFLTVGGRTSAIVPRVQKKTGSAVDGTINGTKTKKETEEDVWEEETAEAKAGAKSRKTKQAEKYAADGNDAKQLKASSRVSKTTKRSRTKAEDEEEGKSASARTSKKSKTSVTAAEDTSGQRRSTRLSRG